jgi:DnaD/phage-associated family protein
VRETPSASEGQVGLKKKEIRIKENSGSGLAELSSHYENNIGVITQMTREMLIDDLEEYGYQVCVDAIEEAVKNNIRKWSYIRGILKNWKANGRRDKQQQAGVTPAEGMAIYV